MYDHHRKARYHAHLNSVYWQEVRQLVFASQGGICGHCRQPLGPYYEVHHKTYAYLFREKEALWSVVALHPDCHEEIHERAPTLAELLERVKKLRPKV